MRVWPIVLLPSCAMAFTPALNILPNPVRTAASSTSCSQLRMGPGQDDKHASRRGFLKAGAALVPLLPLAKSDLASAFENRVKPMGKCVYTAPIPLPQLPVQMTVHSLCSGINLLDERARNGGLTDPRPPTPCRYPPMNGAPKKGVGKGPDKEGKLMFCTGEPNCFTSDVKVAPRRPLVLEGHTRCAWPVAQLADLPSSLWRVSIDAMSRARA